MLTGSPAAEAPALGRSDAAPQGIPRELWRIGAAALTALTALGAFALAHPWHDAPPPALIVSQRGEQFHPGVAVLRRGAVLPIVNDDGEIRHHDYIQAADFRFDSGDQEPGQHTDINFTVSGRFAVLCGIHPRMRLVVTVR